MSGRLWTKGITWKKTALKLLSDGSGGGSSVTYTCDPNNFSQNFSGTNFASQGRKTFSLISNHENSRLFESKVRDLELIKSTYKQFIPGLSNHLPHIAGLHVSSFLRENKNSEEKSTENESGKVGIISSMFQDEKVTQAIVDKTKNTEDSSSGDDKEEKKEQTESPFLKSQRFAKWFLLGGFVITAPTLIYEFGPPKRDEMGNEIPDQYSNDPIVLAYIKRAWSEVKLVEKDIVEPSSKKLLPDPLKQPYYQPPYTLVIELFDVLLHPVYDQVHGWRFKKRPGIDYFLATVGPPVYEIVIFTRETGMVAFPLIDSMDPKGYIMYRLFRDAARFKSGFKMGDIKKGEWPKLDPYYQKDLTYLNRDLKRVIMVDNDKRATELQPSNGISLKPWDGSVTDTELYDLASFLRTIAASEVDDVRPVLEHYRKYEDPLAAFKLAQARAQEEQERLQKQLEENRSKPRIGSATPGFNLLTKYFRPKKVE